MSHNFTIQDIDDYDIPDDVLELIINMPDQQPHNVLRETLERVDHDILRITSEDLQRLKDLNEILKNNQENPSERRPIPEMPENIIKIQAIVTGILESCLNNVEFFVDKVIDDDLKNDLIYLYYIILQEGRKGNQMIPSELLIAFLNSFCVNSLSRNSEFDSFGLRMRTTGEILASIFKDYFGIDQKYIGLPTQQAPLGTYPEDTWAPRQRRSADFQQILDRVNEISVSILPHYAHMYTALYCEYLNRHPDDTAAGDGGSTAPARLCTISGGSKRKAKKSKKSKKKYNKLKKSKKSNKRQK